MSTAKPYMGVFVYADSIELVLKQIRYNTHYWGSLRAKRATVEKYLIAKGLENPTALIDRLIDGGLVYIPCKGYVALTDKGIFTVADMEGSL